MFQDVQWRKEEGPWQLVNWKMERMFYLYVSLLDNHVKLNKQLGNPPHQYLRELSTCVRERIITDPIQWVLR